MSAVIVAAGVFHMYRDELLKLNMQELYASIRDSVTTGYLEPNGISPADFAWPDGSLLDWDYFYEELLVTYAMSENAGADFSFPETSVYASDANKVIFDAAFAGVLNFLEAQEPYEGEFVNTIFYDRLDADHSLIPANVTFE